MFLRVVLSILMDFGHVWLACVMAQAVFINACTSERLIGGVRIKALSLPNALIFFSCFTRVALTTKSFHSCEWL
jgi:hypothetical protein